MENFVITGATGHLGNTLVKKLLKIPHESIKLLVLDKEDVSIFENMKVEIKFGNVLDIDFLKKEIKKDDVVFHMAGIIDITSDSKDLVYKVNVEGTKNLASVCFEKGVKKFIYTSSVHVIKPLKNNVKLDEPTIFEADEIVGDYAKSKTMATKAVFEFAKKGLNAVVTYPAGIIGPNDYKVSEMGSLFLDIANKKLKLKVAGGYNFVDVRDVADGLIGAYKYGKVGEGYLLSGHKVSIDKIFKIVNKKFNRKNKVLKVPLWLVKVFATVSELRAKRKNKKPLVTKYSLYTITSNHNFSNKKAKEKLKFSARSTEESISDAIDWFIKHKKHLFTEKALEDYSKFELN